MVTAPGHRLDDLAIGFELLVLVGKIVAVQEQELAAEEPDARCTTSSACSTSSGSSMFACSSTVTPSSVAAGVVFRRFSFCRSSSN